MANVGLIPMSAKPLHAGHYGLIELAARENDVVFLFVSLSDRDNVSGRAMEKIWHELIEPILPQNVNVAYGGSPVGNAWALLGKASEAGSGDSFTVYSDPDDTSRFPEANVTKYAPNLVGRVHVRGIDRSQTTDISGSKMRELLASGDKDAFNSYLPPQLDGDAVWNTLMASPPGTPTKKRSKKANDAAKDEALLRSYVSHVVRG